MPKFLRWLILKPKVAYGVLLGILGIALLFASFKLPLDPDLFWHLRAGKDILRIGIPYVDWYSHTMSSFFWIDHEYGQQVLMTWLNNLGGFKALAIAYTALIAFTLSVALRWSTYKKLPWTWSLVGGVVIALASRSFIGTRPQMFTYLFILVTLGLVRRGLATHKLRWFVLIPVLFAIWANLHASFLAGFIILLTLLTTESIKVAMGKTALLGQRTSIRSLGWLAIAGLVAVPATFLNPYRWNIWLEPYRTLTDKALHDNIVEWFGVQPYNTTGMILFGAVVLLVLAIVIRQNRADLSDVALSMGFFVAAVMAVRNIPIFLLFSVPLALESLRTLKPRGAELVVRLWPTLLAVALFAAAGISKFPLQDFLRLDRNEGVFALGDYPVGAANFLAEHTEFAEAHPYNEYGWGGYLLYQVPWFKTFIDGRMPSWQDGDVKIIDRYFEIDRRDGWEKTAEEYGVNLFVIKTSHGLVGELGKSDAYKEVYRDENAVVFVSEELAK